MSHSRHQTPKVFATIACFWLFYFLSGIIFVGLVKVEVKISNADHTNLVIGRNKVSNGEFQGTLWGAHYKVYVSNIAQKRNVEAKITLAKGFCIFFRHCSLGCQFVQVVHALFSIPLISIFILNVGGPVKQLLDKLVASREDIMRGNDHGMAFKLKSVATSLLFSVAGLTLCILIRNLFLAGLDEQEDRITENIVQLVEKGGVYLSKVELLLAFYFSVLNLGFFLSLSQFFTTIIQILPNKNDTDDQLSVDDDQEQTTDVEQRGINLIQTKTSSESLFPVDFKGKGSQTEKELGIIFV